MRRPRPATVASALIAVALVTLAVTSATAVLAVARAQNTVAGARAVVTHYLDLQRGVTREAVAEANYRRAPTPTKRLRLENAIAAVHPALRAAHDLGDAQDAATIAELDRLNEQYAAGVRATLDAPSKDADSDRAGAALEAVQDLLNTAVDRHRAELVTATQGQASVMHRLGFVLPTVFALAFVVMGWTWARMVVAHRRLRGQAEDERERALTDGLTGLPNRVALQEAMVATLARSESSPALLYLDLDRFKPVNDELGHHAGDELLQQVAQRLQASVRVDDVAARLGGDEFAVLLPRGEHAHAVADRVLAALAEPFVLGGHRIRIGASIGVARAPEHGRDAASLLVRADLALYDAKRAGRGLVRTATLVGAAG